MNLYPRIRIRIRSKTFWNRTTVKKTKRFCRWRRMVWRNSPQGFVANIFFQCRIRICIRGSGIRIRSKKVLEPDHCITQGLADGEKWYEDAHWPQGFVVDLGSGLQACRQTWTYSHDQMASILKELFPRPKTDGRINIWMLIFNDPASKTEKSEKVCFKEYDSFSYVSAVNRNINLLYKKRANKQKG